MSVDLLNDVGAAGARGGDPLLVTPDRVWSYAELTKVVDERVGALRLEGGSSGRVLPMTVSADLPSVVDLLAAWRLGAVPAPLNAQLTEPEKRKADEALRGTAVDAQAVLWTSGTSGAPRGVLLSYEGLAANARASAERLDLSPEDVWLASLSPAHVGGLALIFRALALGSRLRLAGAFDTAATLDAIRSGTAAAPDARVTHTSFVPTQLVRLLDASGADDPPSTFRCALIGGARAPIALVRRALDARWPVALTYGLTEATSQVATASPDLVRRKPGTVGPPLPGTEVRVQLDGDSGGVDGSASPPTGEVHVRGPTVCGGYIGADATLRTTADGWLATGDVGRLDEDGDLWITGRLTDRIISGGVNVDPVEVEDVLRAHPLVADVCVVGVPDEEWGEQVVAFVVPAAQGRLDAEVLDDFSRSRLAGPKRPRRYHMLAELPRNPNGKVDRGSLIEALAENDQATRS